MATPGGRTDPPLRTRLDREPFRYGFFQAVRLLQRFALPRARVGHDGPPREEVVRFGAEASLAFPASEILSLEPAAEAGPARMLVRFMGLTGPQGALPRHYTALVIERLRRRDTTLAEFLDLVNHRLVSLFYRAWEKYRPHLGIEPEADDPLSRYLFSLFGLGTRGLRRRLAVPDRALLFYSGLLAQQPRSATALAALLGDYFGGVPVRIDQFIGQWLALDPESLSSLRPFGGNNRLGVDAVVGSRVWHTQSRFRVVLGPMAYGRFAAFLPSGPASREVRELVRFFVGLEFDYEFRLVLRHDDIPPCRLGSTGPEATRLGWSTWLTSRPRGTDADDVCFNAIALEAYHDRTREEAA
jgi:type VI secretion system protein ImpH